VRSGRRSQSRNNGRVQHRWLHRGRPRQTPDRSGSRRRRTAHPGHAKKIPEKLLDQHQAASCYFNLRLFTRRVNKRGQEFASSYGRHCLIFKKLTEQQEQFDKAITGQVSAKEALDTIAAFQELLREGGRIK
jgi:hypothetical protein